MIYKLPFLAMQKALFSALSAMDSLKWFDSATSIDKIAGLFKNQECFAYGIFGTSNADCTPNKDTALWESSLLLEVYSNYESRKVIAQELEAILNYFSSQEGWDKLQESLIEDGYSLSAITVGSLNINMPMYGDTAVWQSGSTILTFKLTQIE